MRNILLVVGLLFVSIAANAQKISGVIKDNSTGESIIGASVSIKGTSIGTSTDIDGKFELSVSGQQAPVTILVASVGYSSSEIVVTDFSKPVTFKLSSKKVELKDVTITGSRVSEKQKEAPLTVESIDIIAIKQSAQNSFYEALGTLKGVDLTSASLGFTIVNTRGFNSTSPVRSLQLIDGVDNQSPGLNFSLGNFLGSSELDVLKVDLIAGASSAYYGPNAFNGVIAMTTRSPFVKPGLEVSFKVGERNLVETAVRWSQVFKDKSGNERFAYKLNLFYMKANDWQANNMSATPDSPDGPGNPGGYDAVNVYGDEYYATSNYNSVPRIRPGVMTYYRTGYAENDLVDYNTENFKSSLALHYKTKSKNEIIFNSAFGAGTTVYQGDNRFSLKDILFFQNRIEYRKENKFFIRAYTTNEDAGKSYDAYFTALLLQQASKSDYVWSTNYVGFWSLSQNRYFVRESNFPGYPQAPSPSDPNYDQLFAEYTASINPFLLANYYDSLQLYHNNSREYADDFTSVSQKAVPFYEPGTQRFDSLFNVITSSRSFTEGGSRFYDKSRLVHVQGEYKLTPKFGDVIIGGNYRKYLPQSDGTIFSDTSGRKIESYEFGFYGGLEKKVLEDKLKINLTLRADKNQNFDLLLSPAASLVYTIDPKNVVRLSFSSAIRNPTLTDQYLYYNVGRAKLLGNITGYDSLVTIPSLRDYLSGFPDLDKLSYFNIGPVKPEKVKTIEVGYRASLTDNLYADANYYYSVYTDFIGYIVGADVTTSTSPFGGDFLELNDVFRIASNSQDKVSSQGFSIGLNYFIGKYFSINGNYSWNELNKQGSDDPIIPAYNTPRNKYNLGFGGRDIEAMLFNKIKISNWSYNINYKWVQGFLFEGSPQFTGEIESYEVVDMQISKKVPQLKSVFKVGASNLLNNMHYEVYGGPLVGRLAYASILVTLN
ncbi:MAG TPA: TonB-dependent receptor [Bacteroidia bacterium]|nr:TonB-dependent receptor [Bacteroidota bacterium]MBP9923086.1 TonB-dependent receptor [Bacteroidia bacterium]HQW22299.1 TonB-dependent receptor [Bacteroidia bacterium]